SWSSSFRPLPPVLPSCSPLLPPREAITTLGHGLLNSSAPFFPGAFRRIRITRMDRIYAPAPRPRNSFSAGRPQKTAKNACEAPSRPVLRVILPLWKACDEIADAAKTRSSRAKSPVTSSTGCPQGWHHPCKHACPAPAHDRQPLVITEKRRPSVENSTLPCGTKRDTLWELFHSKRCHFRVLD